MSVTIPFPPARGPSSKAEQQPSKLKMTGSSPAARSNADIRPFIHAGDAAASVLARIKATREG